MRLVRIRRFVFNVDIPAKALASRLETVALDEAEADELRSQLRGMTSPWKPRVIRSEDRGIGPLEGEP